MRWPTISEAWMYGDPANFADALVRHSAKQGRAASAPPVTFSGPPSSVARDRYYRQARHLQILHAMKGKP